MIEVKVGKNDIDVVEPGKMRRVDDQPARACTGVEQERALFVADDNARGLANVRRESAATAEDRYAAGIRLRLSIRLSAPTVETDLAACRVDASNSSPNESRM